MHSASEQRRDHPRSQFELPVVFSGENEPRGITRDVSQGGVYFYTDAPMSLGQLLEFKVLMPGGSGNVRALCNGRVVRVEAGSSTVHAYGVAVRISNLRVEKPSSRPA